MDLVLEVQNKYIPLNKQSMAYHFIEQKVEKVFITAMQINQLSIDKFTVASMSNPVDKNLTYQEQYTEVNNKIDLTPHSKTFDLEMQKVKFPLS